MKLRVLHFFKKMDLGGAETFIMNVYRNINRDLIQFDFAVESSENAFYNEEIRELGGRIFFIPSPQDNLLKYMSEVKELLIREKFDAIHSHVHFFSGINLMLAKKAGVKVRIAHSHTYSMVSQKNLKRLVYEFAMKLLIDKYANSYLGCSELALQDLFFTKNARKKIIYNAVEINKFLENKLNKNQAKKNLGINENSFVIGHVGAFRKEKNHKFILEIFQEFLVKKNDAELVFVGEGDLKDEIITFLAEKEYKKRVHLIGNKKDIENIYKCFDVFLFPSFYEGLGMAVIEAQLSGVVCLVSDRLPTEVDIGNVTFLSLAEGEKSWSNNLLKVVQSKKSEFKIEEIKKYDIQNVCETLFHIYRGDCY